MMKRIRRSLKGIYWRKAIIYLLTCCLLFNTSLPVVMATPSGGTPDISNTGITSITYNTSYGSDTYDHTTLVTVGDTRTVINWESLDTAGGPPELRETLAFTQQSGLSNSAVLNRISGPETQFNGDLVAPDMRIFMINPAGILFGDGSTIKVTQLVASGLNMSNDAFDAYLSDPVNNNMEFEGGNGTVVNDGTINANSVFLVGKKVRNLHTINAPGGVVVLAAGENVYIAEDGSNVVVQVSEGFYTDTTDDIRNRSLINAGDGKIVLAAGDTFSRAISNAGVIEAPGGDITMRAAKIDNKYLITTSSDESNAGNINITGTEGVIVEQDSLGNPGGVEANGGTDSVEFGGGTGDGGNITIQTDGLFQLDDISSVTAAGGSVSGKGGSVSITCNDFEIAGTMSASPGNKTEEYGTLEISAASNVSIANGANAGLTNTLYEQDIETLSQEATNLVVNSQEGITVKNISDNEITGQFGSIELHATGDESAVTFDDSTTDETPTISDTIRTTLGDIVIEAGSGGMNIGNLTTGKDLIDETPAPGQILLTTNNATNEEDEIITGDMTTGNLTIRTGWGTATIDAKSSGNLTVNGDVMVGRESSEMEPSPILNVPLGDDAEAVIKLSADKNVILNGTVEAYAQGSAEGKENSITKANIDILAGQDATINGDILADAKSTANGTADAIIKVEAVGALNFAEGVEVHATADDAAADSVGPNWESDEANTDSGHAQTIINENAIILVDDSFSTPKSDAIVIDAADLLLNDTLQEGESIDSYTQPAAGTVTPTMEGDKITGFTYNPPEDLSTLTFSETGETTSEATDTFTYTINGETATVTISLTNSLPVAVDDLAKTYQGQAVKINVITNDTDPDTGDILRPVEGSVAPKNGKLVLNVDGTFTYTPNADFTGEDSFTYAVTDGTNYVSDPVTVKITVREEPQPPFSEIVLPFIHPAPGLDEAEWKDVEISGSSALAKWVAKELGVDKETLDIQVANSTASTTGIQPYEAYSNLRKAAIILKDADGSHIAALAQVISEFASNNVPPTEEQMASIADAIRRNTDEDSYYTVANEYLDALVTYVGVLSSEMGYSPAKAVQIVTDKYISQMTQNQNVGVAAFLAASLAALGG
jgi:filamentous hemagglutinin family protein